MVQWQSGTLPSCPADTRGQVTCDAPPRVVHNVPFPCDELNNGDRTSKNRQSFSEGVHSPAPGPSAGAASGTIDGQCSRTANTRKRNATSTAISVTGKKELLSL